jgi:hypothetical protein
MNRDSFSIFVRQNGILVGWLLYDYKGVISYRPQIRYFIVVDNMKKFVIGNLMIKALYNPYTLEFTNITEMFCIEIKPNPIIRNKFIC